MFIYFFSDVGFLCTQKQCIVKGGGGGGGLTFVSFIHKPFIHLVRAENLKKKNFLPGDMIFE